MSPPTWHRPAPDTRFPRVSGDEPAREHVAGALILFSPRERG